MAIWSAGPGAGTRELAVGLVAALVDAFQAFRDDCLQLRDFLLLFGFFRIHLNRCCDVNGDWWATGCDAVDKLTATLSETPPE